MKLALLPRPAPTHKAGLLVLLVDEQLLVGPRGEIRLSQQPFRILERLMRKPGVVVTREQLMEAMYPDPDDEPPTATEVLRVRLYKLRGAMHLLGGSEITIVAQGEGSYVLKAPR